MGQVKAGDHIVAARALFGSCRYVIEEWLPRFGVSSTLVDGTKLEEWEKAVRPNTKVFFLESPSNPTLEIIDIAAVARIALPNRVFCTIVKSKAITKSEVKIMTISLPVIVAPVPNT